jgi:hypothetical protein
MRLRQLALAVMAPMILLISNGCAPGRPERVDPIEEQFGSLGESIELDWKHDNRVLTYCRDEQCTRFFLTERNSTQALIDFSYLYLFEEQDAQGDPALSTFRSSVTQESLREVVERHLDGCALDASETVSDTTIHCVLKKMIPRHELHAEEIRMEDRGTYSRELDLMEQLEQGQE